MGSYANMEIYEPVAKVLDNIKLEPPDHPKAGFYKVLYAEVLHEIQHDFGALATVADTGDQEITNLYMPDGELAQYRIYCMDDFELKVKQPLAKTRFPTDKIVTEITAFSHQLTQPKLHRNEIFVIGDEKVFFVATNPTKYSTYVNRLKAIGYRYVLDKLPGPVTPFTAVNVGGR